MKKLRRPSKAGKFKTPVNNFAAKNSVNKSGAGRHKSAKDYQRKTKHNSKLEV